MRHVKCLSDFIPFSSYTLLVIFSRIWVVTSTFVAINYVGTPAKTPSHCFAFSPPKNGVRRNVRSHLICHFQFSSNSNMSKITKILRGLMRSGKYQSKPVVLFLTAGSTNAVFLPSPPSKNVCHP